MKNVDVCIASINKRNHLIDVLTSIIPQENLKKLYLVLNNFNETEFNKIDKFCNQICQQHKKEYEIFRRNNLKGSSEKMYPLKYTTSEYLAFIDDDIIYPENYLEYMIEKCNQYNGIISMHGRNLLDRKISNYYNDRKILFHFMNEVEFDTEVDIIGTGCMIFKSDFFKRDDLDNFYEKNIEHICMDDIYFSYFALKNRISRYVVKHKKGYLKSIKNKDTVFSTYKKNCTNQTNFINDVFLPEKRDEYV